MPACAGAQMPIGEMVGPRKRPDVAGRIGHELDRDFVARGAVREKPGRDRELVAAKRRRHSSPHEAVGAVSADHEVGMQRAVGRFHADAGAIDRHVHDARLLQRCARGASGVEQSPIEFFTAGDDEIRRGTNPERGQRHGGRRAGLRVREARRSDDARCERRIADCVRDDRESAAGNAAAARLFARVRAVDDCHARSAPGKTIRGPRAGGARAHDGDVHRDTLPSLSDVAQESGLACRTV